MNTATPELHVFWQPGCTSCLRTKEFLARHGVAFVSRNILEDDSAIPDLARLGLRQVPIVTRGDSWVDGQVLKDVARIAGIDYGGNRTLTVAELRARLNTILDGARRFLAQVPESDLETLLPNRPRAYADLAYHIFNIPDAFLEHEAGIPLVFDAYNRVAAPGQRSTAALAAYGRDVQERLNAWFDGPGRTRDWAAPADVYYGRQTMHEFLERTAWHAGQHTRQLQWVLEQRGIAPDGPLGPQTWADLPMPQQVWDPA